MGWEHQTEFVNALKKSRCGSEKKIHRVAELCIKNRKWYKHVVKNIREFFQKGFRKGNSRLVVAYMVDAILKAEHKSKKAHYSNRFRPWLPQLFAGCGLCVDDHDNLFQLLGMWRKFYSAEVLEPLKKVVTDAGVVTQEEIKKAEQNLQQVGLANLASIIDNPRTVQVGVKRKREEQAPPPRREKRQKLVVKITPPVVKVHQVGNDPRRKQSPATASAPAPPAKQYPPQNFQRPAPPANPNQFLAVPAQSFPRAPVQPMHVRAPHPFQHPSRQPQHFEQFHPPVHRPYQQPMMNPMMQARQFPFHPMAAFPPAYHHPFPRSPIPRQH